MKTYMTKQEVFDTVKAHLLAQGDQATVDGECVYWDRNHDMKCAVGCLIPEDKYREEIEGHGVNELNNFLEEACGINAYDTDVITLLMDLQYIHDAFYDVEQWKEELEKLKETYDLK